MIHSGCGGKLIVVDSTKYPHEKGLSVLRVRQCQKCKSLIRSTELIRNSEMPKKYKHNMAYKKEITDDTDRED